MLCGRLHLRFHAATKHTHNIHNATFKHSRFESISQVSCQIQRVSTFSSLFRSFATFRSKSKRHASAVSIRFVFTVESTPVSWHAHGKYRQVRPCWISKTPFKWVILIEWLLWFKISIFNRSNEDNDWFQWPLRHLADQTRCSWIKHAMWQRCQSFPFHSVEMILNGNRCHESLQAGRRGLGWRLLLFTP